MSSLFSSHSIFSLLNLCTDWLFFDEIGQTSVFTTTLSAKIAAGAAFGALMLLFTLANLLYACRANFPLVGIFGGNFMRLKREEAARLARPLGVVACAILAILAGQWGALQWENVLLFMNAITVGIKDPIIGQDLGFYFFQLPLLEMLKGFLLFMVTLTMAMMGAVYYLRGGIALTLRGLQVDWRVRRHLAVLLGVFGLLVTAGFFLECFQLLFSGSNAVHGAGYTDVNARLPVYRILCLVTPAAAILLVACVWKGLWRRALLAPIIVFAVYGLGIMVYPAHAAEIQGGAQ